MPIETHLNNLLLDGKATISDVPSKISVLFPTIFATIPAEIKTLEITNMSNSVNIFFSSDGSRDYTNAGGVIKAGTSKEIPLRDIRYSPYFVSQSNVEARFAFWG